MRIIKLNFHFLSQKDKSQVAPFNWLHSKCLINKKVNPILGPATWDLPFLPLKVTILLIHCHKVVLLSLLSTNVSVSELRKSPRLLWLLWNMWVRICGAFYRDGQSNWAPEKLISTNERLQMTSWLQLFKSLLTLKREKEQVSSGRSKNRSNFFIYQTFWREPISNVTFQKFFWYSSPYGRGENIFEICWKFSHTIGYVISEYVCHLNRKYYLHEWGDITFQNFWNFAKFRKFQISFSPHTWR